MNNIIKMAVLAAMATASFTSVAAQQKLVVWEDLQKAKGIEQAAIDFEKETGVKVDIVEMRYTLQLEKIRLDGPAGIGADVMLIPNDQLGSAVVQSLISPIDTNITSTEDYIPQSLEAFTQDGMLYGIPKVIETLGLFYNKDILKEPLETMDEYYEYSKRRKAEGSLGLLAKYDEIYYAISALEPYGAYVFGKDDKGNFNAEDVGFNNKGAIEATEYISKFYKEGLFPVGIMGQNGLGAIDSLFTEGKAAAVINGPWVVDPYQKSGINFGVVPLPKMPNGKDMTSFLGVRGYVISHWSKNKELAQKFINFANQPKYAKLRFEKTTEIPPLKSVLKDPVISENEIASAFAQQALRSYPMPSIPEMAEVWVPMDSSLQLCLIGKDSVENALNDAVKLINQQIEAFRSQM
ncbi:MAG: extracellular solute-binding protein [Succinivibrio sp.]